MILISATIPRDFTDFKQCIPCSDVDIENDEFILTTDLSSGNAVSTSLKMTRLMHPQVCVTGLFFDGQQIEFYTGKESNEQGFWMDDYIKCGDLTRYGYYWVNEIKIKNGIVSTACDSTNEN